MKKRLFIAINLQDDIKQEIANLIHDLKNLNRKSTNIKWVKAENLHLTLQFLGSTDEDLVDPITKVINETAQDLEQVDFQLGGINAFPNLHNPRVIFLSLKGEKLPKIVDFQLRLAKNLEKLGINIEKRPWKAHITVGRVKGHNSHKIDLNRQIQPLQGQIKAVDLMQSQLMPDGPVYSIVYSCELRQGR